MKRGIFFSADAWIALVIILLVILTTITTVRNNDQKTKLHDDVLESLSVLKIGEINNTYVQLLISQGEITDLNKTLLEQIGEFYVTNTTKASLLADAVLEDVRINKNVGIWYGSTLITSKNTTSYESASKIDTTRQLISGIREGGNVTGYSARAQLSNSGRTNYFYFGGYIGDGNISALVNYTGSITQAEIEIVINKDFTLYVNGNNAGTFARSPSDSIPVRYNLSTQDFNSGANTIELKGNNLYIAGGFIKISYQNNETFSTDKSYNFPGIAGSINIYDALSIPGQLNNLDISLHLNSPYITLLTIGNQTIWRNSTSGNQTITITNSELSSILNYNSLSNKTTPLRLGLENVSYTLGNSTGSADIILITDVSGSMNWRLDSDTTGTTITNCSSPSIYSSSTKRISLAKCLDKQFISTILNNGTDNRIGLVSFSQNSDDYIDLTTNQATLNTEIDSYNPSGGTCVSCAINRAYLMLQNSNSSRQKFIIVMTDGVTNIRSTATCTDVFSAGASNSIFSGGLAGSISQRNNTSWNSVNSPLSAQINSMDILDNLGFAGTSNGAIARWNGSDWSSISSPTSSALHSIDILNQTFAIAVSSSGQVLRYNGSAWSVSASISQSPILYGTSVYAGNLMFAVGIRSGTGRVYKSTNGGSTWSLDWSSGPAFRDVKIINTTLAYLVGDNGAIGRWNGNSWSALSSPTSEDLYSIDSNGSQVFAVGGESSSLIILRLNGTSWLTTYSDSGDSLRGLTYTNSSFYALGDGAIIMEFNGTWSQNFNFPQAYQGNSTTGISCVADQESCSEQNSYPSLNSRYSSCRARTDLNATIHSIGFGPIASCSFASQTLQGIASCGNGSFYASSNATALQQIYVTLAQDIIQATYNEQTIQTNGTAVTYIYPDSYIRLNYTSQTEPYGLIVTTEKNFDNNLTGTFDIPQASSLVSASAVSYSGPRWTNLVQLNNISIFNLNNFGNQYTNLGDPYSIILPASLVNLTNTVRITTAIGQQNSSSGSQSNKIIYTVSRNVSGFSPISSRVEGCIWAIEFEDSTNITLSAPISYSGTSQCSYTPALIQYDVNDAAQGSVYNLLRQLDLDNDYKVDVRFSEQDLQITLSEIEGIPYTWSTEVQVRTWY